MLAIIGCSFLFLIVLRAESGAVLLGSRVGVSDAELLAESRIPVPRNSSANDLVNLARGLASQHGQAAFCNSIAVGQRKVFRCGWQGSVSVGA